MPCGWKGNCRSGVALAMRHRQYSCITTYGLMALEREMSTRLYPVAWHNIYLTGQSWIQMKPSDSKLSYFWYIVLRQRHDVFSSFMEQHREEDDWVRHDWKMSKLGQDWHWRRQNHWNQRQLIEITGKDWFMVQTSVESMMAKGQDKTGHTGAVLRECMDKT